MMRKKIVEHIRKYGWLILIVAALLSLVMLFGMENGFYNAAGMHEQGAQESASGASEKSSLPAESVPAVQEPVAAEEPGAGKAISVTFE